MTESSLDRFILDSIGESHLRVEQDYGDGFVRLRSGEAERRQAAQDIRCVEDALIELLRNARDAHARRIFVCSERKGSIREITVIDDGDGIPQKMHELIFEPRVTSKLDSFHSDKWGVHGRGMALFSIAENTQEACVVASSVGLGSSIRIAADTNSLKERTDQSSFPSFSLGHDNVVKVLGPRNLLRSACEFALEVRGQTEVFFGSATEIAAALYFHGSTTLPAELRVFDSADREIGICESLSIACDPTDLAALCGNLGLDISERSARRVLDGQIEPAPNILSRIVLEGTIDKRSSTSHPPKPKRSKIAFDEKDLGQIAASAGNAFASIAPSYYLKQAEPQIAVREGRIVVTIPLLPDDTY